MAQPIPEAVERFLVAHIDSVELLEVLLLLQRSGQSWTGESAAAELRIDPGSAARRLKDLASHGFLAAEGDGYSYLHNNPLQSEIRQLSECYRERRVAIITLIFSKPARPSASDSVRALANAFRIKHGE